MGNNNYRSVGVVLTDSTGGKTAFRVSLDGAIHCHRPLLGGGGVVEPDSVAHGHTERATFGGNQVTIDGNGWRDIESGGLVGNFVKEVLIEGRDAQDFLNEVFASSGAAGLPGFVL